MEPRVALATALHAQPGVYALLLGSGVSTSAGVPTGWGVVTQLVRSTAAANAPGDASAAAAAEADPEGWWALHGDGNPLGYSNLLATLATTSAARRNLLAKFFEPSESDVEEGLKIPGFAHRAVAELVRRGSVLIILTTNFDRLVERALEDAGVSPQVISTEAAVAGMTPLPHSRCTVIKLHGDYADLEQRNTVDELTTYPSALGGLLRRVLDEYGLIVAGWSAEWDVALVAALEATAVRRYPLFWAAYGPKSVAAQRLIAQHGAVVIEGVTADAFFPDAVSRLDALDQLADSPMSRSMAVARLKRLLPDPTHHIEVHDLVMDEVSAVAAATADVPQPDDPPDASAWQRVVETHRRNVDTLLHLVATGVRFDRDRQHTDLWRTALERLMAAKRHPDGRYFQIWHDLQHYPAMLVMRAVALAAISARHDDVLIDVITGATYRDPHDPNSDLCAAERLHDYRVLDGEVINAMPRSTSRWKYPQSHMLRDELREIGELLGATGDDYSRLFSDMEYGIAVVQSLVAEPGSYGAQGGGEYIGDYQWTQDGIPLAEQRFWSRADVEVWTGKFRITTGQLDNHLSQQLRKTLKSSRSFR